MVIFPHPPGYTPLNFELSALSHIYFFIHGGSRISPVAILVG